MLEDISTPPHPTPPLKRRKTKSLSLYPFLNMLKTSSKFWPDYLIIKAFCKVYLFIEVFGGMVDLGKKRKEAS